MSLAMRSWIEASAFWMVVSACVPAAGSRDVAGQVQGSWEDEEAAAVLAQTAYGKASNPDAADAFGNAIALSGDTLAVAAHGEDSAARGINGDQTDNSSTSAGAVYVFVRNGTTWSQQAYLKASNSESLDGFGSAIALSGDTLVVGAPGEASGSASDQSNNAVSQAGAVYVFVRNGTTWSQQAYLKASNIGVSDSFGGAVAVSGDTLAVGAMFEDSAATGVNGNQNDNSIISGGAVYVFQRTGQTWAQQAYVKASNTGSGDLFGASVALSGDTLAVGAPSEDSAATGVNGNQNDNSASESGAAYVFQRTGQTWAQQAYVKASNTQRGVNSTAAFGTSISLSGDTLAVGATHESNGGSATGAAYMFARSTGQWTQQAYLKASNFARGDLFGGSVAVSGDLVVVGATDEDSIATGVNGDQNDNSAIHAGAAYLFARSAGQWSQQAYIKASNTELAVDAGERIFFNDRFGRSVTISGNTLVVSSTGEASGSAGFDGDQADNSKPTAGAVYVFDQ